MSYELNELSNWSEEDEEENESLDSQGTGAC